MSRQAIPQRDSTKIDTAGYYPDIRQTRIVASGAIQPNAHPNPVQEYSPDFVSGLHDAFASIGKMFHPSMATQAMQDQMSKFRGEKAYWEGSPSKTKGALAARMAGR